MTLVLVVMLALPSLGCGAGPNTWTEGDRKSNNQSLQGVRKQIAAIDALAPHATGFLAIGLAAIRADLAVVELNLAKTEEIHHPPEEVVPFSDKGSEAARTQQAQEHSGRDLLGWITLIGTYLGIAVGVATTVLNLPVIGPYLATTKVGQVAARVLGGKIVKMGLDGIKTISTLRSKAEEAPLTPQDVVNTAIATFSPKTAAIADKVSNQIEAASGIKVTPIDQLETPAV